MGMDYSVKKERIFWLCVSTILLFLTIFFYSQGLSARVKQNLSQQKVNDLQVSKLNTALQHLTISNYEIASLKQKGLLNPIENISQDLMNHRELISYKGVSGGTMGFYDKSGIHVLNKKWVLADFDDGHINGYMLLRYDVKEGGVIRWQVIDQYRE